MIVQTLRFDVLLILLTWVGALSCTNLVAQDEKLNVVFVLCDDHRFDCLGAAGHPFLETPHIDSLASHGAMLTHTYVTTSLCSPSRASILTGQYAHNHRVVDNYHPVVVIVNDSVIVSVLTGQDRCPTG